MEKNMKARPKKVLKAPSKEDKAYIATLMDIDNHMEDAYGYKMDSTTDPLINKIMKTKEKIKRNCKKLDFPEEKVQGLTRKQRRKLERGINPFKGE